MTRYADMLSYDQERGVVRALDWRAHPGSTRFVDLESAAAAAGALEAALVRDWAAAYLAGYGLALAAHAWSGRPSEARRGRLLDTAEQLRAAAEAERAAG